ncbi:MAG: uroporphyrinogen decarboxylase family protein [Chloroflexota bacterium]
MSPMTPRERVLAAIHHEEPDRVPLIVGVDLTTGIMMQACRRLKDLLGFQALERFLYDWPELDAANPDAAVLLRLGSDGRGVQDRFPARTYARNRSRPPGTPYFDDWGVGQEELAPGEYTPSIHPLREAETLEALQTYPNWPDMDDPTRFAHVRDQAAVLAADNQFAIFGSPWLLPPFERACQLQGMDAFLLNLAARPDLARALLERIASLCKRHMSHFLPALGDSVDVIVIADDLGTQDSLLMSPKMYRQVLKPIHADWFGFIKSHTHAKLFFHSDGDVFPLIDDLVEIGVDILNPIQTSAGKMADLATLKKRYRKNLAFCGAIDTHRVLPRGTPAGVREEVRRVIGLLGRGGGYMVASVHSIMNDVPGENILTMCEAVEEFGHYPLRV